MNISKQSVPQRQTDPNQDDNTADATAAPAAKPRAKKKRPATRLAEVFSNTLGTGRLAVPTPAQIEAARTAHTPPALSRPDPKQVAAMPKPPPLGDHAVAADTVPPLRMPPPLKLPLTVPRPVVMPAAAPAPGPGVKPAAQPVAKPAAPSAPAIAVAAPVGNSSTHRRHRIVAISFAVAVLLPTLISAAYLWGIAKDQYSSNVAFSVRSEQGGSALEILGGLTQISGSSSSDTNVLYAFIQSQDLVSRIDADLDLRAIWSKPGASDPIFAYSAPGTIEDLADYWEKMVKISYDATGGMLEVRVQAFDPLDAQKIAEKIYIESTAMINQLSDIAREDGIRYAREDLDESVAKLRDARAAITQFRNVNQIVDPSIDTMGQMGLLNTLHQQLAASMVELDLLRDTTRGDDPRITQTERKIGVIQNRINEERLKLGIGDGAQQGNAFANLVGEYERLTVDREFAEQSYTAALATFNAARAESGRQSRYLAAHIQPTLAERSLYPQRLTLLGLISLFLFLGWVVAVLVGYSIKDRR